MSTLAEWLEKDHYLVWIEVEKYDASTDEHSPVEGGLLFPSTARFETLEEAQQFAKTLHAMEGG